MQNEYQIVKEVMRAQKDLDVADALIEKYLAFIKKEVYKYTNSYVDDSCDELSIAMIAFHEAIRSYDQSKGNFIKFASVVIRNRLIDFTRLEQRHYHEVSLDTPISDDSNHPQTLADVLPSDFDLNAAVIQKSSTEKEIVEFNNNLDEYGINLNDVALECPRQARTLAMCADVLRYALNHKEILDQLVKKKRLPMKTIAKGCGISIKTIEHHRKYLVAILLIQTNGYDILRDHIKQVLKGA